MVKDLSKRTKSAIIVVAVFLIYEIRDVFGDLPVVADLHYLRDLVFPFSEYIDVQEIHRNEIFIQIVEEIHPDHGDFSLIGSVKGAVFRIESGHRPLPPGRVRLPARQC